MEGRLSGSLTFFLHWLWSGVWVSGVFFFHLPLSLSPSFHSEYVSIAVESVLYREHCEGLISRKQIYTSCRYTVRKTARRSHTLGFQKCGKWYRGKARWKSPKCWWLYYQKMLKATSYYGHLSYDFMLYINIQTSLTPSHSFISWHPKLPMVAMTTVSSWRQAQRDSCSLGIIRGFFWRVVMGSAGGLLGNIGWMI